MRIISGTFRGKTILAPDHLPVRPTTDFAKTGLFNILASRFPSFQSMSVADLFAGTGSLTYEFYSRGCTEITAVDHHQACIRFISETLRRMNAPTTVRAVRSDALDWLKKTTGNYTVIVADPPFAETPAEEITDLVKTRALLSPGGVLIIEHAPDRDLGGIAGFTERRKYGQVCFSFFMFPQ